MRNDFVGIKNTLPILPAAVEIQMVVIPFEKARIFAAWSYINKGKMLSYLGEMLAMVDGIGKNSLKSHEVRRVHNSIIADGQTRPIEQIKAWNMLETNTTSIGIIATSHHISLKVEGHILNANAFKGNKFPILYA